MHSLKLSLALGFVFLAACSSVKDTNKGEAAEPDGTSLLPEGIRLESLDHTTIRRDQNNGTIRLVKGKNLSRRLEQNKDFQRLHAEGDYGRMAIAFVQAYRDLYKLDDPPAELNRKSVETDDLGLTHIRLHQRYKTLPVWGSELLVHFDEAGHVTSTGGRYFPTPTGLNTTPALDDVQAMANVAKALEQDECRECQAQLLIFFHNSVEPRLAYDVFAPLSLTERWNFVVDANTGAILQKISAVQTAQ